MDSELTGEIFHSIEDGCWDDQSVWDLNRVPSYSDQIFIQDIVQFSRSIYLRDSATLTIDTSGALCGYYDIVVPCGCFIWSYGSLSCNKLDMQGDGSCFGKNRFFSGVHIHPCTEIFDLNSISLG